MEADHPLTALVFSGGLGLGAYHGGAFEAATSLAPTVDWVAGSSAGAITAALIGGSAQTDRVHNLREYWRGPKDIGERTGNHSRHLFAWLNAINTHVFGHARFFVPQFQVPTSRFNGWYNLGPTRERLRRVIDFGRLNAGHPRVTICATDLESGDPVLFDSHQQPIEMDHILASCGFIPEFAPVAIGDKLLGDGGLSLNAPFDPVLEAATPLRLWIVDLFARDGRRPESAEAAAERKTDLTFGNQTYQRLRHALAARRLKAELRGRAWNDSICLLSYRPGFEEAGPEKSFDLSEVAMAQRWHAGFLDMNRAAAAGPDEDGVRRVRREL